jgi:hypothetical protein
VKKRCIAFFDGQNLHHGAKEAFGNTWPNFDPALLAKYICDQMAWSLECVYFYTGIPSRADNAFWNYFWARKFAVMGTRGIKLYSRELSYSNQIVHLPGGGTTATLVGREKGIDIRIALDIVRLARRGEFDVALIFSQDQDLSEVVDEVRAIALEKNLWIKIASAFPNSPTSNNTRGINGTDWIKIYKSMYDACTDPTDYRPKRT